jgi:hypothetical protein
MSKGIKSHISEAWPAAIPALYQYQLERKELCGDLIALIVFSIIKPTSGV